MSYSEELGKLADLHQRGALSDDEYARAKARVIDGASAAASVDAPALTALNQFRRSRNDSWIGGVCGGLAKITGLPSWSWRVIFTALMLCAGGGLLVYLLLWIFVPLE